MQQFIIAKDGFKEIRKKLLIALISGDVVIVVVLILFLTNNSSARDAGYSLVFTLGILIPIGAFTTLRWQKKIFETYRLTVTEDSIIREQANTPAITIQKNTVREIIRMANGAICIIGESKLNAIGIPGQIENREELERMLSEIKPLKIKTSQPWLQYLQVAMMILVMGLLWLGLLNENRLIFTVSGVAMCALATTGFIMIQCGKNFDRRMKRISYIIIIPFVAILANVIIQWLPD